MPTRAQAFNEWFHGLDGPPAEPDVYAAFKAGWDAREAEVERLRKGIAQIRDASGACCETFEICDHWPCEGSVGAHLIALEILK